MAGLESAMPAQPVVKDVQTLKANLKEQEKRARGENEPQEVITHAAPQPAVDEAQRKRQKVNNSTESDEETEIVVLLDGPLPPIKEQVKSTPKPSTPSKNLVSPVAQQKDTGLAPNSASPTKVVDPTELSPNLVENAPATAQSVTNNEQPGIMSKSVESPKKSAVTIEELLVTEDQKLTEEANSAPELKEPPITTAESAPKTELKPTTDSKSITDNGTSS